jgi:hypothetical protein
MAMWKGQATHTRMTDHGKRDNTPGGNMHDGNREVIRPAVTRTTAREKLHARRQEKSYTHDGKRKVIRPALICTTATLYVRWQYAQRQQKKKEWRFSFPSGLTRHRSEKRHRRSTVRDAREDADDSTTPLRESYIIPARPA